MNHYYYLSDLGEINLPSKDEINKIRDVKNEQILFLLDSCVCLDIVTFVKHKESARVDKNKIFKLIEFIQKNEIKATPIFALTELCYDRNTLDIIDDKFYDFKNKIDFAFKFPIKYTKQFDFDYEFDYVPYVNLNPLKGTVHYLTDRLNQSYAALLKIHQLSKNGLKKDNAEKNIELFVDWMTSDLNIFLGLEYLLAIEIFGGNTKMRTMVSLDSKPEKVKKVLWGTAWDLFHARMSIDREQLEKIVGKKIHPIFITKDYALYKIMSPHILHSVKIPSGMFHVSSGNIYPQHFSEKFIEHLNEKIFRLSLDRVAKKPNKDNKKISELIKRLEEKMT